MGRLSGLLSALGQFVLLPLVVVLTPLAVVGAWLRRRDQAFAPFFLYAFVLFGASGLLFAVHVPHGTFIHSAVALLPHTYLLVVAGVAGAVAWVARRRSTWDAARATAFFGYGTVAVAIAGAAIQSMTTIRHWSEVRAVEAELAASFAAAPATDRVMSADPGAYNYLAGRAGIVTPNDDLATIETAARMYDVRWLVLERAAIVPALEPVLLGEIVPSWLSRPVSAVPASGAVASTMPTFPPEWSGAVYAICFEPTDSRCAQ